MKINKIILTVSFWIVGFVTLSAQIPAKIESLLAEKQKLSAEKEESIKRIFVIEQDICRELITKGIQARYVNDMDKRAKERGIKRQSDVVLYDGDTVKVIGFYKEHHYSGSNILIKIKERTTTVESKNLEFFVSADSQKLLKDYFDSERNQTRCNELREKMKDELFNSQFSK
jgi:hypothetical protein